MTSTTHTPNELAEALEGEKRVVAFYKAKTTGLEEVQKALVEALKELRGWCDDNLNGAPGMLSACLNKADAALAAAKAEAL